MKIFITLLFTVIVFYNCSSQIIVKGTVLDKSKTNFVEAATVLTSSGKISFTDSLGKYSIEAKKGDSIYFKYNNKPTQKFAVDAIPNTNEFDIALQIPIKGRYSLLKEVTVFSKNYKSDSTENREAYAKVFSYHKPGLQTSVVSGGGVGLDADEIINIFRFKRNKRLQKFQEFLEKDEQEKYVNYRFNKRFVKRITQLSGAALDSFMIWYKPSYSFVASSDEVAFNQYILNASYHFKKMMQVGEAKKE